MILSLAKIRERNHPDYKAGSTHRCFSDGNNSLSARIKRAIYIHTRHKKPRTKDYRGCAGDPRGGGGEAL